MVNEAQIESQQKYELLAECKLFWEVENIHSKKPYFCSTEYLVLFNEHKNRALFHES